MTYVNELRETRPYLWAWQPRRLTLDALTGQKGTIVRAASASAPWDSWGASLSVVRDRPCWTFAAGGTIPGLAADTITLLHWGDWSLPPVDLCGLVDFNERGPTATGGILHIGPDTVAGSTRLTIYYTPNSYRVLLTDGTNSIASTASVQPVFGNRVRLRWRLRYAGGLHYVRLWQSINGGAEVAATESSGLAGITTFGATAKLRLNSIGASNCSAVVYQGGVIARGDLSLDQLLEALNP